MSSIPFTEKYRPNKLEQIILDPHNRKILENIVETEYFPNLLLYGPPGTGKTTSCISLINAYQEKKNQKSKDLIIHLNASDERGIDIIRNQINQFVNSKTLFTTGMKFVILDEVDYMTKNAQQALKYLLQSYNSGIRFCLICNYISRIDEGLQNEFLRLRFNQLPESDIVSFLKNISHTEELNFSDKTLSQIQKLYKSDIRSMINFMQTNQNITESDLSVIDSDIWDELYTNISNSQDNSIDDLINYINIISVRFNIDKKNIIKDFLNYIIRTKPHIINSKFLSFVENIMHVEECKNSYYVNYSLIKMRALFS
jgi:DNA polymerase III delta prime subunit